MKRAFRVNLVLCLVLGVLAGCAASTPFTKADNREGKALVYLFRPESLLSRGTVIAAYINGEQRGLLINNSYLPLYVDPGKVAIELRTNDFLKNRYDALTLEGAKAGETYVVKADPGVFGAFTLVRLDPAAGMKELEKTLRYQTR